MAKRGKKYRDMIKSIKLTPYPLSEAVQAVKKSSYSVFPGTIELHLTLRVTKEKEAKSIKGSLSLPHPVSAKETRIIVFCEKEVAETAVQAGAIEAGCDNLIKKIQGGWSDFDIALATASVMPNIAILGKELGPKGLMPNPKTGTIVEDVTLGVHEFLKGKTKYSCDEGGSVHIAVGTVKTDDDDIIENITYTLQTIADDMGKPVEQAIASLHMSVTMGAGVKVDTEKLA